MKPYFILLFLCLSMGTFAQVRLGNSASEIRSEFSDSEYEIEEGYTEDNIYYINFITERAHISHLFDENSVAVIAFVSPNNQGQLNYYVETYNEQYVIVSDKEWKMYSDGGVASISLQFNENDGCFFRWVDLDFINKLQNSGNSESENNKATIESSIWTGSGFAIGNRFVATNYHVVENAQNLSIFGANGNMNEDFEAKVIASDKYNDIAILEITDDKFKGFGNIKYGFNTNTVDVGTDIFVLGYPLTNSMGTEIKLTDGLVSAKTGFQGDISQYQISAPVQSGSSGGPLFDEQGNVIGIISSKHNTAENVSYAVKLSYLKNLIETTTEAIVLSPQNKIQSRSFPNKIKTISPFVVMIKGDGINNESTNDEIDSDEYSFIKPYVEVPNNSLWGNTNILSVDFINDKTVVIFEYITAPYVKDGWVSLSSSTEIIANNKTYKNKILNWAIIEGEFENISALEFNEKYTIEPNTVYTFSMVFSLLPKDISVIDIIEDADSESAFNWKGIYLVSKKGSSTN